MSRPAPKNPFDRKAKDPDVRKLYRVWKGLRAARRGRKTWRAISAGFEGVPAATLNALYKHGRVPRAERLRAALGLSVYAPGRVCPVHGIVHDRKCRPRRSRPVRPRPNYRRLFLLMLAASIADRNQKAPAAR